MASRTGAARSTGLGTLQTTPAQFHRHPLARAEAALDRERDRLALWLPVMLGCGIAIWYVLPGPPQWIAAMLGGAAVALAGLAMPWGTRSGRALLIVGLAWLMGIGGIWWRAERVSAPVLARPVVAMVSGRVESVRPIPAQEVTRLVIATHDRHLPPTLRINVAGALPPALTPGAVIRVRARLMPPGDAVVPGAYDFARVAWFGGIGATGRGLGAVTIVSGAGGDGGLRARLFAHIHARLPGSAGGIAAALATGDVGAIADEDQEAMRRAGLAHLLSVSGLHVTAVVGATMLLTLKLLALSPWLALRVNLRLVAAATGAAAAIGYTWLAGMEVPTVRSCIAALLVLLALAIGREPFTLRLVAVGATVVLLLWPESIAGPSFQMSFAAVAAIIALHEHASVQALLHRREEGWGRRIGRALLGLLLTGIAVELTLMPIALYHFHKAGLYGALANIVAIPFTTFVVMPLEAGALLLDAAGLGAPLWWATGLGISALLGLAHWVSAAPGAVTGVPHVPDAAFALAVAGGLWLMIWNGRKRYAGLAALGVAGLWIGVTPAPDLLVTGDGRHAALRGADGRLMLLRERAGDYVRSTLGEAGGVAGDDGESALPSIDAATGARCSRDLCVADVGPTGQRRRVLATRSRYFVDVPAMRAACAGVDIAISDRRLPTSCRPRWLKLDRPALADTGGLAITLTNGGIRSARRPEAYHPWRNPIRVAPPPISRSGAATRPSGPARAPAPAHNAAAGASGWRDQAGSLPLRDENI